MGWLRYLLVLLVLVAFSWQTKAEDDVLTLVVADPFIDLYTGPGRGYPKFFVVERGGSIEISKRRTDWFKVKTAEGKEGWVHKDQLVRTLNLDGEAVTLRELSQDDFSFRQYEAGVLAGDYGGARSLTLYGGIAWTENISTELSYSQALGEFSDIQTANASVIHQPFPDWRFSPFFKLGAGMVKIKPSSSIIVTEDRQDSTLLVGGGLRTYLTRQFLVRLEYNSHVILTSRDENDEVEEWKIGFSFFF